MKPILAYQQVSNTIRQLPQNYMIASFENRRWVCEPDLAADHRLCLRVFKELLNYDSKYESNGLKLLAKLTPNHIFSLKK